MSDSVDDMQLPFDDPEFWRFVMTSLNVSAAQAPTALGQQYPAPSHRSPPIREPGSSVTRHPSQHQAGNFQPYGFLPPGPVFNHHGSAMGAPPQYLQTATPAHAPYEPLYSSSQHPSVAYSDPEGSIGMPWAQNASSTQPAGSTSGVGTWPTSNMISTDVVNPQTGPIPGGTGLQLPQHGSGYGGYGIGTLPQHGSGYGGYGIGTLPQHGSGYGGYGIGTPPPGQQYGPSAVQQPSRQVPSLAAVDTEAALQFYRDGEYADYSPTSDPDGRFSTTPSYMLSRSPDSGTYSNIVDPAMSRPDQVTDANQANYNVSTERPRLSGTRLQATAPATTSGAAGPYHFPQDGRTAIPHSWAPHDVSQVDPLAIGVDFARPSRVGKAPKIRKARAQPTASVAAQQRPGKNASARYGESGTVRYANIAGSSRGGIQSNGPVDQSIQVVNATASTSQRVPQARGHPKPRNAKDPKEHPLFELCCIENQARHTPWIQGEQLHFCLCAIHGCTHVYSCDTPGKELKKEVETHVEKAHVTSLRPSPSAKGPRVHCPFPNCPQTAYTKHLARHLYECHLYVFIDTYLQFPCEYCQQSHTRANGLKGHLRKCSRRPVNRR